MGSLVTLLVTLSVAAATHADLFTFSEQPGYLDVLADGKTWLRTVTAPYDAENREETYKVYTHIFDFAGESPITKGHGGKYSHHRGMFIGWKDTLVGTGDGQVDYDTWHMDKCFQEHVAWQQTATDDTGDSPSATQLEEVLWKTREGEPFIRESRRITARLADGGVRVFDFGSTLTSLRGVIQLRGDLQHAGMQVRMANEVSEHAESTQYLLPEGGEELDNDKVVGAWWVCCSPVVREKRYWLVHMTPPDHPTGEPVYSIRRYARFGAFFELDLIEGKPVDLSFRIAVSEKPLDAAACQALYEAYAKAR